MYNSGTLDASQEPAQTPPNVVPPDLFVSLLEEVSSDLAKLSTHKAAGQDGISLKSIRT